MQKTASKTSLEAACVELAGRDTRLKKLIDQFGIPEINQGRDPYQALVHSIVSQQISWKAARAIFARFLDLFPSTIFPSPELLVKAEIATLRTAGLSQRKAEYVLAIAEAFLDPDFLGENIDGLSDTQVSAKLTSIRGVGQWTADMFMIFTLARLDVLPLNDQGIKNGMQRFFQLEKSPSTDEMLRLTEIWKPYRSVASWYMWKVVDEGFEWGP